MKNIGVKISVCVGLLALFGVWLNDKTEPPQHLSKILRIYNWAHYIPPDIIEDFEKEMQVKVSYDVFETLETLEAKLLAARSGYDVVFPTAWPTVALFIPSGAFLKLDLTLLPNRRFLDPALMRRLQSADPGNQYVVPYLWGTTGLAYNANLLDKLIPEGPRDSWELVFNPLWVEKLNRAHVALLDSASDVFPSALLYLKKDPNDHNPESLREASEAILAVRPWITKFDSSQTIQDLISGHVCVAQVFSSYGNIAARQTKDAQQGPRIVYTIPREGALMWMDVIAIPKDAPNQKLAHAFINFLMRPDIMGRVTNKIQTANAIPASKRYITGDILGNPGIYPAEDVMKKVMIDDLPSRDYRRTRLRLWTKIKTGH